MIFKGADVFDATDGFVRRDIYAEGERIVETPSGEAFDCRGLYAVPGLIDLHLHGCVGGEFAKDPAGKINEMLVYEASRGVTAVCPTTLTLPEETLAAACLEISKSKAPDGAEIVGINLEGPFISRDKLGAQNPEYVRAPDASLFRRLQKASGGIVKLLDIAPEEGGALDLISELSDEVICSVAHTATDYDTATEAFRRGARQVTHLYNAMPPFHHREPGVVGAAFDAPECRVELICDGVHVHPSVVRATFKMFGDDRIVMISDSMMATGMGDGDYEIGGLPVEVSGNRAALKGNGNIAGSVSDLMQCVRTAVREMGIPLYSAIKCASVNPAKQLGIFGERGDLATGKVADIVLLDEKLDIRMIVLRGKLLRDFKSS